MNVAELLDRSTERGPEREAVRMFERRFSYRDLQRESACVAGGLRALGIRPGDRILIFADNGPEYLVAYFAAARLGAILATVNPAFREAELDYILANAGAKVALVGVAQERVLRQSLARAAVPGPRAVRIDGPGDGDAVAYEHLRGAAPLKAAHGGGDDGVLIAYTSGSTAHPKPVFHSHQGELFAAETHARLWELNADDRLLVCLPLAWMLGLNTGAVSCLAGGGTVVIAQNLVQVPAIMRSLRVTALIGVTTTYIKLLPALEAVARTTDLSALRLCLSGGEPQHGPVFERFTERFCPVFDIYASSECRPLITYDTRRDPRPRRGSAGRLVPGAQARIVGPDGAPAPAGQLGELWARSPGQMLGYFREPELTSRVLREGWVRMSDLLRVDADGYHYFGGRVGDMIIRGGTNIAPAEVEAVLAEDARVAEAAVFGVEDDEYGQAVHAFVALHPGATATAAELQAHCRSRLAPYKVPERIEFVSGLPRGATGKLDRRALRQA